MKDLHKKVLAALSKSTSANSISYTDLMATTKLKDDELFNIIKAMYEAGIVNRCYITKRGLTDNYYWLTGFKGKAQTLGPDPTGNKKTIQHKQEPARWTAIKQMKNATPTNSTDKDTTMSKLTKSDSIRKLIDETPGITHQELLYSIAGETAEKIDIINAEAVISYAIKGKGYTVNKSKPIGDGNTIKSYYKDEDFNQLHGGPDVSDGHDWEGFKGGCARFNCKPNCSAEHPGGTGTASPIPGDEQHTKAVLPEGMDLNDLAELISESSCVTISKDHTGKVAVTVMRAAAFYKPELHQVYECLKHLKNLDTFKAQLPL
jgi:hypothetical protein